MSAAMLPLRDYQAEAIDAVTAAWERDVRRPLVMLPTGAGKTVVFAHMIARLHAQGIVPLVIVHTNELVEQACDKISGVAPHLRLGVVKAQRHETDVDCIVATVQTVRSEGRREGLERVGRVIVDEAHHATATSYRAVLDGLDVPAVGFTATAARGDRQGLGGVWDEIVFTRDILDMIDAGHLVEPRGKLIRVPGLKLGSVKTSGGDYTAASLGEEMERSGAAHHIAEGWAELAPDRPTLAFAPTVATAHELAMAFAGVGASTGTVWGAQPVEERALVLKKYAAGELDVVTNCAILTEGFDAPRTSCVVMARPTKSKPLHQQIVGRALRPDPAPGSTKRDALVIYVDGSTSTLGLAGLVDLSSRGPREVRENESIYEALQREADEATGMGVPRVLPTLEIGNHTDVELFARSKSVWLTTKKGMWFIPTLEKTFFLWPHAEAGIYTVGVLHKNGKKERLNERVTLGYARAWGEQHATEANVGINVASKSAGWRRGKVNPDSAQARMGTQLGIDWSAMTKGELSDLISVELASRALDRML